MSAAELNPVFARLDARYDHENDKINDYMARNMRGEDPDPAEFLKSFQKRLVTQQATEAYLKLYEKGKKTVMNEAK
ncbi:hypothetical protein [Actimicrobium sp. CCI2.3]|uniref:hypothetical protein n=1 Tax=Actimicrobium sp. CCI2.3 TaxID=3048616 RepID=UPI002AB5CC0E|nr:hypothetical protein [Actimicrobium sp. CCI2.3]MDY7576018.1 hypothetical protein [Actimicrobium sp. CCI2.3]MEB0023331.1 hypothetical protein [Actimicrobium sp. CCI2.3]